DGGRRGRGPGPETHRWRRPARVGTGVVPGWFGTAGGTKPSTPWSVRVEQLGREGDSGDAFGQGEQLRRLAAAVLAGQGERQAGSRSVQFGRCGAVHEGGLVDVEPPRRRTQRPPPSRVPRTLRQEAAQG